MRETKYWLDIYGPPSHAELQFQLRTMLTRDETRVARILMHYGDALRMSCHAKRNGRPMKYDTWAEYVGLLCEEVFTCGPHPLLDDDTAPTENPTQVANKDTAEIQASVKVSDKVVVQDPVEETVQDSLEETGQGSGEEAVQDSVEETGRDPGEEIIQNPAEETVADTVENSLRETVRELVRQTVREMIRETEEETGIEPNSERPVKTTNVEPEKGSLRKSFFQGMRKMTRLKKKETAPSPEQS